MRCRRNNPNHKSDLRRKKTDECLEIYHLIDVLRCVWQPKYKRNRNFQHNFSSLHDPSEVRNNWAVELLEK